LDHRLDRLGRGYGIRVPMYHLPLAFLGSKNHRNPQSDRGDNIFTSANLGLGPLHPHYVGKLSSYVLLLVLNGDYVAISERLRLGDVLGLRTLLALTHLVGDLLSLLEAPEPATLYGGEVHEEVLTPVIGSNEPVALVLVEPLNCSLGHKLAPTFLSQEPSEARAPIFDQRGQYTGKQRPGSCRIPAPSVRAG
jgi:hypothetical protein